MRHVRFALAFAALLNLSGCVSAQAKNPQTSEPGQPAATSIANGPCPAPTGSRIAPERDARGECPPSSQPTRTYSKEDLDTTGSTNVDEALRKLDPAIR